MGNRKPLSQAEKERVYQGKMNGATLAELAKEMNCSRETVRKWWRKGRKRGEEGLRTGRMGRKAVGILSQFDERVAQQAAEYKRNHHGWGADRVLIELRKAPELQGLKLPQRSRLAAFFKARCPDCLAQHQPRPPSPRSLIKAQAVHEVWQMDNQEEIALSNGEMAVICNIRDPYGAAPIASQAFSSPGKGSRRSRKLTVAEFRQVLRTAFTEWQTLPDSVWTDNELRLIGNPSSDFPGLLTLYLVGLGIRHIFIRPATPTDHAQIERNHRTFDNLALNEEALQDREHLQQALDHERQVYLLEFPCHASDCRGRPPLVAHPELLHPRRVYHLQEEPLLFSMERVFQYLATFTFQRKVSDTACVALAHQVSIGRKLARTLKDRVVWIRCDPMTREWVIYQRPATPQDQPVELTRRPITHLTYEIITGLDPNLPLPVQPVQLPLPFPVS
jgi:transposase-like protein